MPNRLALSVAPLLALSSLLAVPAAAALDGSDDGTGGRPLLQLLTGAEYSRGDYGLPELGRTEVWVVPLSARLRAGAWSLRATLPLLDIRGPAAVGVLVDDGGGAAGAPGGNASGGGEAFPATRRDTGPGDLTLSLTRAFNAIAGTPLYADAIGRLRLPSGDADRGLGSGAVDVIAGGETGWAGRAGGVYGAAARRFLGNGPRQARVDGWQWSAGGWWNLGAASELGLAYGWRAASVRGAPASRSVEINAGTRFAGRWQVGVVASRGLSDGAPDWSLGLTLSRHLAL